MPVTVLVDSDLLDVYGAPSSTERYHCRFGLRPAWRDRLLPVPQTSSRATQPHPFVTRYLAARLPHPSQLSR